MVLKNPNKYESGKTTVLFIRHGDRIKMDGKKEVGIRIPGPSLSTLGKKQAKDIAKKIFRFKEQIDNLYCSNMARAIETAEEISKTINRKPKIIPELSEFNKCIWEKKIFKLKFWRAFKRYISSFKALDNILKENKGKFIVIVAHGNVIKGLILKKLGLSFKQISYFHHTNCAISSARFSGTKLDHINCFNSKDIVLGGE